MKLAIENAYSDVGLNINQESSQRQKSHRRQISHRVDKENQKHEDPLPVFQETTKASLSII